MIWVSVDQSKGMLGTFAPTREPYVHTLEEETTPSGVLARGLYSAKLKVNFTKIMHIGFFCLKLIFLPLFHIIFGHFLGFVSCSLKMMTEDAIWNSNILLRLKSCPSWIFLSNLPRPWYTFLKWKSWTIYTFVSLAIKHCVQCYANDELDFHGLFCYTNLELN